MLHVLVLVLSYFFFVKVNYNNSAWKKIKREKQCDNFNVGSF